jgi:hypothetical protein
MQTELDQFKSYGHGFFGRISKKIYGKLRRGVVFIAVFASLAASISAQTMEMKKLQSALASQTTSSQQIPPTKEKLKQEANIIEAIMVKMQQSITNHIEKGEFAEALEEINNLEKVAKTAQDDEFAKLCDNLSKAVARTLNKKRELEQAIKKQIVLNEKGKLFVQCISTSKVLQVAADRTKLHAAAIAADLDLQLIGQPVLQITQQNSIFTVDLKWEAVKTTK